MGTVPFFRRGFTLIELLVVVLIVAMLAAITLGALRQAQEAARAAKTKAVIAKLNALIMQKWDSYKTRRVAMFQVTANGINPFDSSVTSQSFLAPGVGTPGMYELAMLRLSCLRDVMRMEMPDRWTDIVASPTSPVDNNFSVIGSDATPLGFTWSLTVNGSAVTGQTCVARPALSVRYYSSFVGNYQAASSTQQTTFGSNWASAKCLFMIVMAIPGAAEQFQQDEIGNPDNDGFRVFVDGWGNPINFIRWPVGFVNDPSNGIYADGDLQSGDPTKDPDPFDPRGVFVQWLPTSYTGAPISQTNYPAGFAIYPLIYSAGPDGEYDLFQGAGPTTSASSSPSVSASYSGNAVWKKTPPNDKNNDYCNCLDPYRPFPASTGSTVYLPVGCPASRAVIYSTGYSPSSGSSDTARQAGVLHSYDNIHNHRIEMR
jgi:prepilin-type N-terminal cleavage/methylation domain-containing protein